MIDTHSHIDFPDFDEMRSAMLERFRSAGGEAIVDVGCDMKSSERAVEMAQKDENIFASVGIHPHDADSLTEDNLRRLEELLDDSKVVAMGEIGLDFFKEPFCAPEVQEGAFRKQLGLAEKCEKPIIIHCREAYAEVLEILRGYKPSGWKGVLHCFTASPETAKKFVDLGFYIGFTGVVTYYKPGSKDESFFLDTVKSMPLDRILVETDAPYLTPIPHRGEINEPLFVRYVIEKIAEIRKMDARELERITSENARRLFGI